LIISFTQKTNPVRTGFLLFIYSVHMRIFSKPFLLFIFLISVISVHAQPLWPKAIVSNGYTIKIYQPTVESYSGNTVKARGAFSILSPGKEDPIFGALWLNATLQTNRDNRTAILEKVKIDEIKFAGDSNASNVARLKALLEREIPKWDMVISLSQLEASLEGDGSNNPVSSENLSTTPPKIIYSNIPSTLVLLDGEPKLKENKEMGVEMVMNTAFTIVKVKDLYYLNGASRWYSAKDIRGPWTYQKSIPNTLDKLNDAIKQNDQKEMGKAASDSAAKIIPEIIVSTEPAELIQSNGEADFTPIKGTNLLYMTNTNNDVFMYISSQQYYVLLSGRWYKSANLKGPWTYTASDKLPLDFAKIPEGSEKDDVLSSVAGTEQAQDAVMDAEIPQTAKVDRKTATAKVSYDGEPKFVSIAGTNLQYAVNTSSTVLLSDKTYYCVENGIWFEAISPKGPWAVSTTRPAEVSKIPATVPVYNVKYVYVYEVTPQYVYVGYTPGYMGCYVYGNTVVYGTGYYYNPWYGPYYYPRPVTYGFSVRYNPYYGWGVGFHYSAGWFNYSVYRGGYHGGYWGPPMYRPPYYHRPGYPPYYRPPYYPRPGYRPPVATPYYRSANNVTINNNIYRNNRGVSSNDLVRPMPTARPSVPGASTGNPNNRLPSTQPANRPSTGTPDNKLPSTQPATRPTTGTPSNRLPATSPNNSVITDKQGNVFQKDGNNWQQRTGNSWQNVNQGSRPAEVNKLNQQQQSINRGNTKTNNYNQSRQAAPSQRPAQQSAPARGGKR
jgi:hypothetical protein